MSDQPPQTSEPDREPDGQLFELLDRYVEALHRNDLPSQSEFLERHPELKALLRCLNSLERLAPPAVAEAAVSGDGDGDADSKTLLAGEEGLPLAVVTPPPDAFTPCEFGKYELWAELGRGGMGAVYQARQKDLDRPVAVKMILSSRFASDDEVRRFYAEARAAGRLRHPNIVGIHEAGQIDGQHYFSMDYVEGQTLAQRLHDGPVEPEEAARCLAAVARAVDYLHSHQIVHRDLKPSNILLDAEGTPYVTDFGLAKVFEEGAQQTRTGTILGTPSYMAPEQAAGRTSEISPQTDVYSLGALLYTLLVRRPPFQRENPLDTLVDVLEGEPTLPCRLDPRIPRELELICMRCLEKDSHRRYASAAELADDLERFLKREPITARPAGLWPKLQRWGRREPALVSRLAGLSTAAAIVQVKFMIDGIDTALHGRVMATLGLWAVVSLVCQRMLHRESLSGIARFSWAAADAALLTTVLVLAEGPQGPLLIGYPLLIAAAGLFFQVRLVWFMTLACLVSYAALLWLRPEEIGPPHYPIIFAAVLAVLGFIVAYQVARVRALSRYYEYRRLP